MALELITGRSGTPHVDSADVGALNAALFSNGVAIAGGCAASVVNANTVNIAPGELLCEGRHVRITGSGESLTIANGTSGSRRNDIIALHYTRNSSGIESVSILVVQGAPTSGTPTDPSMPNAGKVLNGASDAYWPLYRVPVDGLTPKEPVALAASIKADDRIVAHGTTDNWRWIKYESGYCVLERSSSYSASTPSKYGDAWYQKDPQWKLPFAVIDGYATGNASTTLGLHWWMPWPLEDNGTKVVGYHITSTETTNTTVAFNIRVVGRWK